MKLTAKILSLAMALVMALSFEACGEEKKETPTTTKAPETTAAEAEKPAEDTDKPEIKNPQMDFAPFTFKVNGVEFNNEKLKDLQTYKIGVSLTNKKGETKERKYGGYAIKDVLKAAGVENATKLTLVASDGYESTYEITEENAPYTLVAIEQDRELSEEGKSVWFAPCLEKTPHDFTQKVVEIKAE